MVFETMDSASWSTGARPAAQDDGRPNVNLPGTGTLVPVSQTPFRVVIAEDEALIRLDLKEMLEEEGYVVAGEAADGEAAIDLATKLQPDLVILDVKMPILDGISAAKRIAAAHIAPVVILTAFSQRELVERARDAGAMAYLVKPFTKADLVPAIEIAASRFQETSALESEVATLKDRLEVRKILDRAKGKLQAEHGLTEPEAFRWIQKTSMDQRLAMRAVAERLLEGGIAPNSPPADGQRAADGKPAADGRPAADGAKPAADRAKSARNPEAKATEA
jgi:AmiR/NasT family two-component response regulator